MITLYDHPFSPYAQKVKISLREKGLAFTAEMPGGLGAGGAQGPFVEASPRAEVPGVCHDMRPEPAALSLSHVSACHFAEDLLAAHRERPDQEEASS